MKIKYTNTNTPGGFLEVEIDGNQRLQGQWVQDSNGVSLDIPIEAGLNKLWKALGIKTYEEAKGKDVFTLAAELIERLRDNLNWSGWDINSDGKLVSLRED